MIDYVSLGSIWGENLHLGAETRQSDEHCDGLCALRAIVDTVSVEDDRGAEVSTRHAASRNQSASEKASRWALSEEIVALPCKEHYYFFFYYIIEGTQFN